eukprot:4193414-Pyramimonas_sp.AAC.1
MITAVQHVWHLGLPTRCRPVVLHGPVTRSVYDWTGLVPEPHDDHDLAGEVLGLPDGSSGVHIRRVVPRARSRQG